MKNQVATTQSKSLQNRGPRDFGFDKAKMVAIATRLGLNAELIKKTRVDFTAVIRVAKTAIKSTHVYMTHPQLITKALKRPDRCPTGEDILLAPIKIPAVRWRDGKRKDVEVDAAHEVRMDQAALYGKIRMETGDMFVKKSDPAEEEKALKALHDAGIMETHFRAYVPLYNVAKHKARVAIKDFLENCHEADPTGVPLRITVEFVGVDREEQSLEKGISDEELAKASAEAKPEAAVV